MNLRNIAIIAHVDHGKTTLIDGLLKQSKTFRDNEAEMEQELIMDSNDQERERGITILAKNTSVNYKGIKINIIDTPGHADFSGEVERTLNMADGALLLVDAQEGPMPQTKFVLRKALEIGLKIIVIVNKIDKKDSRINEVINEISDLFLEVATKDSHLDFPVLYAIGREGKAWNSFPEDYSSEADLSPIFESVIKYIPFPQKNDSAPFQMLVSSLNWDSYKGKYVIGRINRGKIKKGDTVTLIKDQLKTKEFKIENIYTYEGLKTVEIAEATSGEIASITGIVDAEIGDTITDPSNPESLLKINISEPTLSISVGANTSPLKGTEGTFLTSRHILKRIEEELQTNVAMKFSIDESGKYIISGRGELHLCVFLETLRREGFELEVGKPKVITKIIDGKVMEPIEEYTIDVPTEFVGAVTNEFGKRKGIMKSQIELSYGHSRLVFEITTRASLGLRSILLSLSKGFAITSSMFVRYQEQTGDLRNIRKGVLIASETGKTTAYALNGAQERGMLFVNPGVKVYGGMIIGLNARDEDIEINVCKEKHLTNMRSKGEEGIILNSYTKMSLEQSLGFIEDDELLELTPLSIRLRKRTLDPILRKREKRR